MGIKRKTPIVKPSNVVGFDEAVLDLTRHTIGDLESVAILANVDWLTCTSKSRQGRIAMYKIADEMLQMCKETGGNVKTWPFRGYTGFNVEGFRWGTRTDSDIIMASGLDAEKLWRVLLPIADNVSRLDLAVTVETDKRCPLLLKYYFAWDVETQERGLMYQRGVTASLMQNNFGGQTLYVGSRFSDQMGRVYDKAAEQKMYEFIGKFWRYEVEFKNHRAKAVADRLLDKNYLQKSVSENIRSTVFLWFDSRDVPPIFDREGEELSLELEAKVTSDEIALNWLSTQVKPTVQRLLAKGKQSECYESLGIVLDKSWH